MFKIEDKELPMMLCGSSLFLGEGLFGFRATDYRIKFYNHPDSMADIFVHFIRQGCKGVHVLCYDNIVKAVKMAYDVEKFPVTASLIASKDISDQLKALSRLEPVLVFVSPSHTDALDEKILGVLTGEIRNAGMIPGLTTHQPEASIPLLEKMDIDFSAYMTPINKKGKHMVPNRERALNAVKSTEKKVIASKPLAVRGIKPAEGFPFVMEHADAFCPGFSSKDQIDDAYRVLNQLIK